VKVNRTDILDLTGAIAGRELTQSDASFEFASTILPTVPTQLLTLFTPITAAPVETSTNIAVGVSRTNQALLDTNFYTLGKGYWRLQFQLVTFFNWLHTAGSTTEDVMVALFINGSTRKIMTQFAELNSVQTTSLDINLLLNETALILFRVGLTGVGQTTDSQLHTNCIKLL
jgi:hypothetical protein